MNSKEAVNTYNSPITWKKTFNKYKCKRKVWWGSQKEWNTRKRRRLNN